ncbi:site-specific DNA-methyltransferase [Nostoc punctiforme UO1]|uniref:site-specific DNA-methyltransferase n=1 Tax=Nostoc punctiforme TaxID=272131 RepID=UPI0030AB77AE
MNRLIWGDNLLAMQALLAQGYAGKIDLIYIDPPFASEADYTHQITIEGKQVNKEVSIIERLAYTDTWEAGLDSYLDMMYPRLQLMKRLLSENGSIYVHADWRVDSYLRLLLDEVFGSNLFVSEIVWYYSNKYGANSAAFDSFHNTIYLYAKGNKFTYNPVRVPVKQTRKQPYRKWNKELGKNEWQRDEQGNYIYVESDSKELADVWEIPVINPMANERLGYSTQKPERLLEIVIQASSNEGDLVADFFCGSGTTMAVAERLNRRWVGSNLDKVGIQVSRNRLVNQGAKPFLLENIGNYQRHMIYLSGSKINEMQRIILKLYGAAPRSDRPDLGSHIPDGQESELVYVGYPDRPVTAKKVIELAQEAEILDGTGYKTLVVLAWDYDYNFNTELENRKAALRTPLKVNIKPLTIPPEIYNYLKKAKNEAELDSLRDKITFHEKPYLKVSKPEVSNAGDGKVVITLKIDRYVLMNYPIPEKQQVELRKAIKDNFAALIDYWAIDWDYDGKTFRSTWQAIRGNGKQASTVVTVAASPELPVGKRAIAVRLVDVFGNDASATVEVK